jgi:hypothetical protein
LAEVGARPIRLVVGNIIVLILGTNAAPGKPYLFGALTCPTDAAFWGIGGVNGEALHRVRLHAARGLGRYPARHEPGTGGPGMPVGDALRRGGNENRNGRKPPAQATATWSLRMRTRAAAPRRNSRAGPAARRGASDHALAWAMARGNPRSRRGSSPTHCARLSAGGRRTGGGPAVAAGRVTRAALRGPPAASGPRAGQATA